MGTMKQIVDILKESKAGYLFEDIKSRLSEDIKKQTLYTYLNRLKKKGVIKAETTKDTKKHGNKKLYTLVNAENLKRKSSIDTEIVEVMLDPFIEKRIKVDFNDTQYKRVMELIKKRQH